MSGLHRDLAGVNIHGIRRFSVQNPLSFTGAAAFAKSFPLLGLFLSLRDGDPGLNKVGSVQSWGFPQSWGYPNSWMVCNRQSH